VLGMIEAYVGPEAFRKGVSSYLEKYATSNAAGEDFWMEMTRVTEKPVNRIMKSFVDQPGAPVLSVSSRCVSGATEVTVRQQRFVGSPDADAAKAAAAQTWTLPVCVTTGSGEPTCSLVTERQQTLRAPGCGTAMVNADARGYYLTEYEPAAVAALATRTPPLTPPERISLLGDEWRMVRAGRHDIGTYLDLAGAFANDHTPAVLNDLAGRVGYVASFVADAAQRPAFEAWTQARFRPALDAVGLTGGVGDSDDTNRRRGTLLQLLDSDPTVQQHAKALAEGYLADPATLAPTLVGPVLAVAAAGGDAALYDRYMGRITTGGASPEDYYRFFNALPAFHQPALVTRTLEFALSPEVRSQDTPVLVAALLGSPASQQATWTFVKAQWPALTAKLGVFQGVPYVVGALGSFCTVESAEDISAFFKAHPVPEAVRALQQAIERIDACAAVHARQSPAFGRWLEARR
jgi:aminopeptidase N